MQRIAALLVLWWYFYATAKTKVGSFLKKVTAPRSTETFPKAKELLGAVAKGVRSVVVRPDEEVEEEEINKRVDKRIRELILLALNRAATDDGAEEEDEDESDSSATIAEAANATSESGEESAADPGNTATWRAKSYQNGTKDTARDIGRARSLLIDLQQVYLDQPSRDPHHKLVDRLKIIARGHRSEASVPRWPLPQCEYLDPFVLCFPLCPLG